MSVTLIISSIGAGAEENPLFVPVGLMLVLNPNVGPGNGRGDVPPEMAAAFFDPLYDLGKDDIDFELTAMASAANDLAGVLPAKL